MAGSGCHSSRSMLLPFLQFWAGRGQEASEDQSLSPEEAPNRAWVVWSWEERTSSRKLVLRLMRKQSDKFSLPSETGLTPAERLPQRGMQSPNTEHHPEGRSLTEHCNKTGTPSKSLKRGTAVHELQRLPMLSKLKIFLLSSLGFEMKCWVLTH